jgi:putative transcriptional regulator
MLRHGWHVAPGDTALLFDTQIDERWPAAFRAGGIDVGLLSTVSGRA